MTPAPLAATAQELLFEGPALAPRYHQGYQLTTGSQLQKQFGGRHCKDAWGRFSVPEGLVGEKRAVPSREKSGAHFPLELSPNTAISVLHNSSCGSGVGQVARGAGWRPAGGQMVEWHMGLLLRKEKQIPLVLLFIMSKVVLSWIGVLDWLVRDRKNQEKQER